MSDTAQMPGTARDFDFWMGSWTAHNRRLRERFAGCDEWDEFAAAIVARPVLNGMGNVEEFRTDYAGGYAGLAMRFFDPGTRLWSIYRSDSRSTGLLEPPVVGGFDGDVGVFEGPDTFAGRPILVRYTWSGVTTPTPRWGQALSDDDGQTWETNFVSDFTRAEDDR